jgi:hypothetical protein
MQLERQGQQTVRRCSHPPCARPDELSCKSDSLLADLSALLHVHVGCLCLLVSACCLHEMLISPSLSSLAATTLGSTLPRGSSRHHVASHHEATTQRRREVIAAQAPEQGRTHTRTAEGTPELHAAQSTKEVQVGITTVVSLGSNTAVQKALLVSHRWHGQQLVLLRHLR